MLKKPVNTGRPNISGGAKTGKEMTCENGTWAPDLLGAFLYRAPASFDLSVAEERVEHDRHRSDVHAHGAGDYTCTLTATNQAGRPPRRRAL